MTQFDFIKMHGLGNDFVIIDARTGGGDLDDNTVRAVANRQTGIGCDQLIVIEPARMTEAAFFMRIRNADGSEVDACGNAARCVADRVMTETGKSNIQFQTGAGLLTAYRSDHGITVDMGLAQDQWHDIPLALPTDTLHLPIKEGPLSDPTAVSIGNPHMVFFVEDAQDVSLADGLGRKLEHHALYPERTNVEAVEVRSRDNLRVRVWERGVGITEACGTGACAALVAANRRGLTGRSAKVELDGGIIHIDWRADGHVFMAGPAATSFTGTWKD